jgi:transcription elongation factor GreA
MASTPLTVHGASLLREELHRLKHTERPSVINAISEARAQGDLSENAEYDAAKERQGFVEARISELEAKLSTAQIIDPHDLEQDGRVVFGVTVQVETGEVALYQIVGEDEADLKQNKISISSPISRALIGKSIGDVVTVQAPSGAREVEILDVRYE